MQNRMAIYLIHLGEDACSGGLPLSSGDIGAGRKASCGGARGPFPPASVVVGHGRIVGRVVGIGAMTSGYFEFLCRLTMFFTPDSAAKKREI